MTDTDFITPDNGIVGAHAARILLKDVAFASIEAKLLGGSPTGNLGYRLPLITVVWSKRGDRISAIFPFSLIAESKNDDGTVAQEVAAISVVMHIEYRLIEKNGIIEAATLPHVVGTLGYMHAWPYFRADVQWLTSKLGFPALVLPVVTAGKVRERVVIRRNPVVADDSPLAIAAEKSTMTPPALPPAAPSEPRRPSKSRRKR